jgi:hypothetical protein
MKVRKLMLTGIDSVKDVRARIAHLAKTPTEKSWNLTTKMIIFLFLPAFIEEA